MMSGLTRDGKGRPNLSRETKFSGANEDREQRNSRETFFSVQLTMSRVGNHTRLSKFSGANEDR